MADPISSYEIGGSLQAITRLVETCQSIAAALIETDEAWHRGAPLISWLMPTDFERARKRVMIRCQTLQEQLLGFRRRSPGPEAILAGASLKDILRCCEACPQTNARRLACKKSFGCLVQQNLEVTSDQFRLTLDEKGDVIEIF